MGRRYLFLESRRQKMTFSFITRYNSLYGKKDK
uniref:Uncharacterized protein n=2 Tax=Viruses TaxID=10239 RepID=A0A8S5ULV6_9VIRU|nr:MAG TPA: hypothetical protein [Phage sp. ctOz71]DAG02907.1 MAG TPA: hypothetical protein [Siphoviridae sp. ctsUl6]